MVKGDDNERVLKKYCDKKKPAHITLINKRFYNGLITEVDEGEGIIIFNDIKLGELFISFTEVERIEPFKEKKNGWEEENNGWDMS